MNHTDLFNLDIERRRAESGGLLVAEPFLRESYFRHAVIALIDGEDDEGGTMGVVMNRATNIVLADLMPGEITRHEPVPVNCGGPVGEDRLFFIHTLGPDVIPETRLLSPGLWVGGDFEAMKAYVNAGYPLDGHIRFFLGYSSWSPGQLSEELAGHIWAVANTLPDPEEMLRDNDDAYWHKVVRSMGPAYRPWTFHPENPSAN